MSSINHVAGSPCILAS